MVETTFNTDRYVTSSNLNEIKLDRRSLLKNLITKILAAEVHFHTRRVEFAGKIRLSVGWVINILRTIF